jgi:hypothetical protein
VIAGYSAAEEGYDLMQAQALPSTGKPKSKNTAKLVFLTSAHGGGPEYCLLKCWFTNIFKHWPNYVPRAKGTSFSEPRTVGRLVPNPTPLADNAQGPLPELFDT